MDYFQHDLALIHARGYGRYADHCAPGVLELLSPVRGGLVLELGCGAGALTRHLLTAGYRVIATDASTSMLEQARAALGSEASLLELALPDDPLPQADAVVSVGHVISYLPDAAAVDRALVAMAGALRPGGVLAIDVCDLAYGPIRAAEGNVGRTGPDWAIITEFSGLAPDKIVRDVTTFVSDGDGRWRRGSERHENVLVDTSRIPALLGEHGVAATVGSSFGDAELPPGLRAVTGRKRLRRAGLRGGLGLVVGDRAHGVGEGLAAVAVVTEMAEARRGG
jgi:SAM-dependent methyltransferase